MNQPEEGDRALSILRAASGEVRVHLGHQRGRGAAGVRAGVTLGLGLQGRAFPVKRTVGKGQEEDGAWLWG